MATEEGGVSTLDENITSSNFRATKLDNQRYKHSRAGTAAQATSVGFYIGANHSTGGNSAMTRPRFTRKVVPRSMRREIPSYPLTARNRTADPSKVSHRFNQNNLSENLNSRDCSP